MRNPRPKEEIGIDVLFFDVASIEFFVFFVVKTYLYSLSQTWTALRIFLSIEHSGLDILK